MISLNRLFVPFVVADKRLANLFPFGGFGLADPDVAESHGVSVILKTNGQLVSVLVVLRRSMVQVIPLQLEVIEDQNSVVQCCNVSGRLQ